MNNHRDILFKCGLILQLALIPVAFLWHFSQEANYYNWVITISFIAVATLFLWPQAIQVRTKRLAAIKLQLISVLLLLVISWPVYLYFHNYVAAHHAYGAIYTIHFDGEQFGRRWVTLLEPGISVSTAILITAVCTALPLANLYRYQLDKKRINGVKKEELFM
ncbi:MAG TPA: hypothetical protein VLF71_01000 [Candidatus Saccharimonadales bacterium]|nr:hypothetical protein [Candidatus Saccharimonadales bacterium]